MLSCLDCKKEHDLNLSPDTGECLYCKGTLSESGENFKEKIKDAIKETFNLYMKASYLNESSKDKSN